MNGRFTRAQRQAIWDREDGCCAVDGKAITGEYSIQHRKARGMGGTRRRITLADGVLVCGTGTTGHHGYIESHPQWALSRGYRVTQQQDPALVPVWVAGWGEVLLDPDQPLYVGVSDYPEGA